MTPERLAQRVAELSADAKVNEVYQPYWVLVSRHLDEEQGWDLTLYGASSPTELSAQMKADDRPQYPVAVIEDSSDQTEIAVIYEAYSTD